MLHPFFLEFQAGSGHVLFPVSPLMFSVCSTPHPWLQTSSACSLSLRICGLLKRLWYTEYMPRLLLAKKQLFLDGGLVHSGGRGQGKERQSASRWPRNADAQAPCVACPGFVTSSKWLHLSEFPPHFHCLSMALSADETNFHKHVLLKNWLSGGNPPGLSARLPFSCRVT